MLENLGRRLGPRFVVDNRSGAAGNFGTSAAAGATPDGDTLLISASGPLAINVSFFNNLPCDPAKDFEPIGLFASTPNVLVAHNELGVRSVAEFVSLAQKRPGAINYGSVGNGSSQHIAAAMFELITGVKLTHVPFRAALVCDRPAQRQGARNRSGARRRARLHRCEEQGLPITHRTRPSAARSCQVGGDLEEDRRRVVGRPDDPNVCLLRVDPLTAELWDGPASAVVEAFEFAKARLTSEKPNLGENRKVTVKM